MAQMKLTPFEDLLDEFYGKAGSPRRDELEKNVEDALHAYRIGEAIKAARKRENLTQALGAKTATIDFGKFGKVALW